MSHEPRRPFQFTLRTLFIVTTGFAILCSYCKIAPPGALAEVAGMFAAVFGLIAVAAVIALACDFSWRAISRLRKKGAEDRNGERMDEASGEE
jgi:predicted membrane channel-forming protein YqfA (hemolysin III family)